MHCTWRYSAHPRCPPLSYELPGALAQGTREVTAELMTYNAALRIMGYMIVVFKFSAGGKVEVSEVAKAQMLWALQRGCEGG